MKLEKIKWLSIGLSLLFIYSNTHKIAKNKVENLNSHEGDFALHVLLRWREIPI